MLFALGFLCSFIVGGISGVMTAMVPIDIHVTDTYFIVAHIHFVLFAGSVFTIFAGIYHWFPEDHRADVRRAARPLALLADPARHLGHVPADALDRDGRACRAASPTTPPSSATGTWRSRSAGFMLGAAQLVFLYNMVVSWKWGPRATANPWRAKTIEWQVSSPPPRFNFPGSRASSAGPTSSASPALATR